MTAGGRVRVDGRTADQMRPLKITPDFISTAEGSVLIELGNTRVICTATVDDGVPGFLKGSGKGWVTSEYGMLPRATEERTAREATRGKQSGRAHGVARLRCDSGRRRDAGCVDYRRVCGAGAGVRTHGGRGNAETFATDRYGGGDERGDCGRSRAARLGV